MELKQILCSKSFEGYQKIFSHYSNLLKCTMKFGIYLPPGACDTKKVPVLYFLSGLTCNELNFIQKSGAQKYAAEHEICIVNPDTSPRDIDIPGHEEFGAGASFYLNATKEPWSKHYQMFDYITSELIDLIHENFPVIKDKQSIIGHSMGGHGALICKLKKPTLYQSVSAFAPVCNAALGSYGQKALKLFIGDNHEDWMDWSATDLVKNYNGPRVELFIDQGTLDEFYDSKDLRPEDLVEASRNNDLVQCILKMREGYDHSYYYVSTFFEEHIRYHAKFLKNDECT